MMVKTLLDKNEIKILLNGFLQEFQNCINQSSEPTVSVFEKYLDKHFLIASNGKTLANSLVSYFKEIKDFQKRYSHCEIQLNKEEIVCGDHAFACYYQADLTTQNDQQHKIYMMVIATLDNDKIKTWKQVTHENSDDDWSL